MSIAECVAKLVATGTITKGSGDEALALYQRAKGEYSATMGPAAADAAAALAVARDMAAGAKKMKYDAAKQALGFANLEQRVLEHPQGPVAGVMATLVRDIWEKGGINVETQSGVITDRLAAHFQEGLKAYSPGVLGLSKEQSASIKNMIYEIFHHDSGDKTAKAAGRGYDSAVAEATALAKDAGRNFNVNENWHVPQPWDSSRVRRFDLAEFKRDFLAERDNGGISGFWDRDTNRPVTADKYDFILERARADIIAGGGTSGAFSKEMRTFEFADGKAGADSWLKMQAKYGAGDNIIGLVTGHLSRMAREIALSQVIAPNHEAALTAVMRHARAAEGELTTAQRFNPVRALESVKRIEQTYDVLTGRANIVDGPVLAGVLGGLRSISTAAQLKGAIISSVPGDSVTSAFAANAVGMAPTRLLGAVFREVGRGGAESKALATRMMLNSHSAVEYSHGFRFFQDQMGGPESFKFAATVMIRAQGLAAWTELIKRTFSMEMMGHLADHAGHDIAALKTANPALGRFLDRHQISGAEWDKIRASKPLDVGGATYLEAGAIGDRALEDKLLGAVREERSFAMLEPDARIRAMTTGGLPQGTLMGEVSRSTFLFKSFSMTMAATHMMRIATQGPLESRLWNGAAFVTFSAIAGAASLQAKNMLYGKDPQTMNTASFWAQSLVTGGGLGIYGDLINSSFSRSGRSPIADLAGPIGGMVEDVARLTSGQVRKHYEGGDTTFGAEAVKMARRYTPGTFYTKLAVDRFIFDQVQMLADPDYRGSFRRMEKRLKDDNGQKFWFRPGKTSPDRGPDVGQAVP